MFVVFWVWCFVFGAWFTSIFRVLRRFWVYCGPRMRPQMGASGRPKDREYILHEKWSLDACDGNIDRPVSGVVVMIDDHHLMTYLIYCIICLITSGFCQGLS